MRVRDKLRERLDAIERELERRRRDPYGLNAQAETAGVTLEVPRCTELRHVTLPTDRRCCCGLVGVHSANDGIIVVILPWPGPTRDDDPVIRSEYA